MSINTKVDSSKCFLTSNFYTACFLYAKGLELVNIEENPTNPKRSQFVFKDVPERENLIQDFNFAKEDSFEVAVDARKFIMAIKMLKDKLYQGKL